MQRLVRKVVTFSQPNLSHNSHRTIFRTRPQCHTPELPYDVVHSCRSNHTISTNVRASLFQRMIVRQFSLTSRNALPTIFSKSLPNRWLGLPTLHFRQHNFNFNRNYGSYRSSWRSWFHRLTPDDVVLGLIVANVAVFMLWRIADKNFMLNNFTISLDNIKSGRLHTLITHAFSHVDTQHILFNMIGLYFFGTSIVSKFGPEFLLKLYLAGAVGGSVFYLVHQAFKAQTSKGRSIINPSSELALGMKFLNFCLSGGTFNVVGCGANRLSLLPGINQGASGAVNAITLLSIFLNPKATIYLEFFIPVPAMLLGIFLIGKDMLRIIEGDSRISGSAHLGGAAVAAITWIRLRKGRF